MEGKTAAQRARLVPKTGMNTLRLKIILWAFYEKVDIQCPWRESGVLVEKFEF